MAVPSPGAGPARSAVADEVRDARAACGWTPEEMADALAVLPVEVAAWEAGTLAPADGHLRWVRWHAANAALDGAIRDAGLAPCGWIVAHRERLARRADRSAAHAWHAREEMRRHHEGCAACADVRARTGALPAVPGLPAPAGLRGWMWMDRGMEPSSRRQRRVRRMLALAGLVALAVLLDSARSTDAWRWVAVVVVAVGATLAARWLDRRHPRFAGALRVAVVIACLVIGAAALTEGWGLLATSWLIPVYFLASGWLAGRDLPRDD